MSALFVDKIMIDALITAARAWMFVGDSIDADTAGLTLWRENAIAAGMPEPTTYTLQTLPGRPRPVQVLRWADTYAYQAADYAAFRDGDSPAAKLIAKIRREAAARVVDSWPLPRTAAPESHGTADDVRRSFAYTSARTIIYERNRGDANIW